MYVSVRAKFYITLLLSICWLLFCIYLSIPWIKELTTYIGSFLSVFIITFIALIPGFISMFLTIAYLFDKRPKMKVVKNYPAISIIIPAYNEEKRIKSTIESLVKQTYQGIFEIIIIDDGSVDGTCATIETTKIPNLRLLKNSHGGKAKALNTGVKNAKHDFLITLDADTYLMPNALENIMRRYLSDPPNTVAVAGSVFVKNSRENLITKMQEWEYFLEIAAIKRVQSLFQGTLVAQGSFSLFVKQNVIEVGGWQDTLGEDIVLSWGLIAKQYRIGFAEEAISFTVVPSTYIGFFSQRRRWARGLIEAFRAYPGILFLKKLIVFVIYWNAMFPIIDVVYVFVFIPGLVLAFFGHFFIVGPMTLAVLPIAIAYNIIFFITQKETFKKLNLNIRKNFVGLIFYGLLYKIFMAPACVYGYLSESLNFKKKWHLK